MFGQNPKRAPEKGDGLTLSVQDIFPTLQGEGPHTGVPAVFVRLGGCNLACDFCDTEFESFENWSLTEILEEVEELAKQKVEALGEASRPREPSARESGAPSEGQQARSGRNLIVITGGEPLRQNIAPLCRALLEQGYQPQIETNGTLWRELPPEVEIICSPKASGGGYHPLREDLVPHLTALKYIVSLQHGPYTQVPPSPPGVPVWLQPMDEYDETLNRQNLEYAVELAEKYGYKLSLQTHKWVGID